MKPKDKLRPEDLEGGKAVGLLRTEKGMRRVLAGPHGWRVTCEAPKEVSRATCNLCIEANLAQVQS